MSVNMRIPKSSNPTHAHFLLVSQPDPPTIVFRDDIR